MLLCLPRRTKNNGGLGATGRLGAAGQPIVSPYAMKAYGPRGRCAVRARSAAAVSYAVSRPSADQMIGCPWPTVDADRIGIVDHQLGGGKTRPGARPAGIHRTFVFQSALALLVDTLGGDAGIAPRRIVLERIGSPAALEEGHVLCRLVRHLEHRGRLRRLGLLDRLGWWWRRWWRRRWFQGGHLLRPWRAGSVGSSRGGASGGGMLAQASLRRVSSSSS